MIATVYVTKNFGFRRGEIYFADLDPHYGSEQGGKRPVIVIQNNTGNKFAPTVIVAAVTSKVSKKPNQPTHVLIEQNPAFSRPSVVLLEQIFTIDKERIKSFMGMTSEWEMAQIEKALKCSLALDRENMNQERGNLFGEENLNPRDAYRVMLRDYPDVLNIDQMCEILSVSTKTGYAILKKGSVQHLKVGRSYRIPKAHLLTYLIGFAPGHTIRA